jgi:hypothetical protein
LGINLWLLKNVEGTTLTDDEVIIASSLKQFALFLTAMETEMSLILEHANQKFIQPLDKFGKEHIGQFFGPKWHSPIGLMPLQRGWKSLDFQDPTHSRLPS